MSLKTQTKLTIELGDICEFVSGGTPSKESENYWGGEIPWVTARDLKTAFLTATRLTLTQAGASTLKRAPKGAIVILVRGMTLFKDIPVAVLRMPMCFNQDIKALVVDPSHDSEFIAYQLLARKPYIQRLVDTAGHGTGRLDTNLLKAVLLKLPTLPEQQKIAAFLGSVDSKLAALRRKQAGLERFKAGLMQRLFSQKLRFTRDDGSAFPDWEEKRLGDVAEINPRIGNLPDEFFYIDLQSVTSGTLSDPDWISLADAPSRAQRLLTDGDILFQMVRPYQRNNLHFKLSGEYVGSTGYAQLRAHENSDFLFQALHEDEFVSKVIERCTGTGYPSINSSDLSEIPLSYPHPDEQRKIADALSALDMKITATAAQITKIERFKQGLLQQMFV